MGEKLKKMRKHVAGGIQNMSGLNMKQQKVYMAPDIFFRAGGGLRLPRLRMSGLTIFRVSKT